MLKILLIRHMETEWNEEFRYIGRTDLELSPRGLANAAALAEFLKDENITRIYTSKLRRAKQTAKALADGRSIKPTVMPSLNEIDFGRWEGKTHKEIKAEYNDLIERWLADPERIRIPAGESWADFEKRVIRGWRRILETGGRKTIAVITHGGPIKVIIGHILTIKAASYWQIYQDRGAVNAIRLDGGRVRLALLNDTCYRRLSSTHKE